MSQLSPTSYCVPHFPAVLLLPFRLQLSKSFGRVMCQLVFRRTRGARVESRRARRPSRRERPQGRGWEGKQGGRMGARRGAQSKRFCLPIRLQFRRSLFLFTRLGSRARGKSKCEEGRGFKEAQTLCASLLFCLFDPTALLTAFLHQFTSYLPWTPVLG